MTNHEYWAKREAEQLKKNIRDEKQYQKEIDNIYKSMMDSAQKEIESFYAKYADSEGITLAQTKRRVSRLDMEAYSRKAEKYVKNKTFTKEANEEMRLYNATMKINRLEMLKANIGLEMVDGFNDLQQYFDTILTDRTLSEFERQAGILGKSIQNNQKYAHAIVNASFHNATFSDRIWMHQDLLRLELAKQLRTGLIQGRNPRQLAKGIRDAFGANKSDVERLMRTELARAQTEAQKQSYDSNGYEQYEFIAESSACDICAALDGKIFDVEEMQVGKNASPMHPNCRCSSAAYMDGAEFDKWLNAQRESGIIDAEIDEFTPCLRRMADDKLVDTETSEIFPKKGEFSDWEFDWTMPKKNGFKVYELKAEGDNNAQGLIALKKDDKNQAMEIDIVEAAPQNNPHNPKFTSKQYAGVGGHLFAEAVKQSYEAGFDGFVFFKAKTDLIDYYSEALKAKLINPGDRTMIIDERAAKILFDKYYGGK
jgi:phage putative head morphogenesis protein, SPP1 gp7 family